MKLNINYLREQWAYLTNYNQQPTGVFASDFLYKDGSRVKVGDIVQVQGYEYLKGGNIGFIYANTETSGGGFSISVGTHIVLDNYWIDNGVYCLGNAIELKKMSNGSRISKARRLWRKNPIFAYGEIVRLIQLSENGGALGKLKKWAKSKGYDTEGYTWDMFLKDLTQRRKKEGDKTKANKKTGIPFDNFLRYRLAAESLERYKKGEATPSDYKKIADCANLRQPVKFIIDNSAIIGFCAMIENYKHFVNERETNFIGNLPPTVKIEEIRELENAAGSAENWDDAERFVKKFLAIQSGVLPA